VLRAPLYANLILGSVNTAPATAGALAHLVAALPPGTTWAAGGIGPFQLPMNAMAIFMGGHVRTGLEDNIKFDKDRLAKSNAELVKRVADLCGKYGRHPASAVEARKILQLAPA
jgi:uncharacterized protein (DUF849 family)